ncbi:MAG TPA: phosphotransferase [Symbiobacteriaceae bacterium]|nr:phosphotransferase [Symbiobacteriaceae bacterium]
MLRQWGLSSPWRVRPAEAGTNNQTLVVEAGGERYILRVYQNTADRQRILYEHRLLSQLEAQGLPFAVPAPVPAVAGDTLVPVDGGVAALFRWIDGEAPERRSLYDARLCGAALGVLDRALAAVDPGPAVTAPYTDLRRTHPLVPAPEAVPGLIPGLRAEERRSLGALISTVESVASVVATLPRQVIHADYCRPNVLLASGRVTGILDFEFATCDARLCDYAVGLHQFAFMTWGTGEEWPLLEAFSGGYRSALALSPAELQALPSALLLVRVGSLLHWTGRMLQGLAGPERLLELAQNLLALERWLAIHGARLLEIHT